MDRQVPNHLLASLVGVTQATQNQMLLKENLAILVA
jgi:hypothetical protein